MKSKANQLNTPLINLFLLSVGLVVIILLLFTADASAARPAPPPPKAIAVLPAQGSHDAEVDTPVSITYDQDMDPATVNPGSFVVQARQTGRLSETLSVDGGTIMLQPLHPLHAGELVQVSATTQTLSLDGEAPVAPTVWQFTTAPWGGNGMFDEHQLFENENSRFGTLGDLDGDGDLDAGDFKLSWIYSGLPK